MNNTATVGFQMKRSFQKYPQGFTVLEVLVSVSILTVALVAIYQSFASSLFLTASTSNLWKAMVHSQTQLFLAERNVSNPLSVKQGTYEAPHEMEGYRWTQRVQDVSPFSGVRVRKITYELKWDEGNTEYSYSSEIYVEPK